MDLANNSHHNSNTLFILKKKNQVLKDFVITLLSGLRNFFKS